MHRIRTQEFAETIGYALSLIPEKLRIRLEDTHFLTGVDPVFAGFHKYLITNDGRSYRDTPHCCWPWNISRSADERITTVVVPKIVKPWVIIHELGHVLDYHIDFSYNAIPITEYAKANRREAFAEAFTAWIKPPEYNLDWLQDALYKDKATIHFFEELCH